MDSFPEAAACFLDEVAFTQHHGVEPVLKLL